MRKKVFWHTLIVSAAVLAVFGVIGAAAADVWYTRLMVLELRKDAALVLDGMPGAALAPEYAAKESKSLSFGGNDVRVTIIDAGGAVVGDSSADWRTMENHAGRAEVAAALRAGWGSSQRHSDTLKVRMLYVAVYDAAKGIVVRTAMPLVELQNIYSALAGFLLASLAASLGIAALLARRTARLLSQPVVELAGHMREIAGGNYDVRPATPSDPELRELSDGLVKLARDLSDHISALEKSNAQLTTVLSGMHEGLIALDGEGRVLFINGVAASMFALEKAESAVGRKASAVLPSKTVSGIVEECLRDRAAVSREIPLPPSSLLRATASPMRGAVPGCILLLVDITQMRRLENMRRDFVSNVTHELRTPLTSIRGYVEALQSGALSDPGLSAKFLQIIDIESERLTALIDDLLVLSEIESVGQDTGIRAFRLSDVAQSAAETLALAARDKGVEVRCAVDEGIGLTANPDRVKQMLLNLIDNAVKYNRTGGSVTVSAAQSNGLVRISVKDTGIGISEEHAARIFERFYRVDKGRSRSMGGTGLGLSIVRHIAELYHGNVRLISEPGRGSEFIIELPV